jgi:chloramphenicol-sensitive protein RarD
MTTRREQGIGVACALGAFLTWGISPTYFKMLAHVPPMEVLYHRIGWSALCLGLLLAVLGRLSGVRAALRDRRTRLALLVSALLIAFNWLTFVWAVATGHLLQSSLGYFINPLVNVALGMIFLRERLRPWQLVAVGFAVASVAWLTIAQGVVPWVALALGISFGFYGLIRKTARIDAMGGLFVETLVLLPLALGHSAWLLTRDSMTFGEGDLRTNLLLGVAGIVTVTPLTLFHAAARRLTLSTVGFFQYVSPTCQLLLAVLAYGEPFTRTHFVGFAVLWTGIAIYTVDSLRALRRGDMMSVPREESA